MSRPFSLPIALIAAALGGGIVHPAAAAIPRPEKAKMALQADRTAYAAGAGARLSALVAIEGGWHVNSHTPTFPYLIPTVLEVQPPAGWPQAVVEYPAAETKSFAFADVPLSVYAGDVVIQVRLSIPQGAQGVFPVHARLQYQACNDSQCLPPVTTESVLSLTVGAAGAAAGEGKSGGAAGAGAEPAAGRAAPAPLAAHSPGNSGASGGNGGTGGATGAAGATTPPAGSAGAAGVAGSAASAGTAGAAGSAGTVGAAGSAGAIAARSATAPGSFGLGGSVGATGSGGAAASPGAAAPGAPAGAADSGGSGASGTGTSGTGATESGAGGAGAAGGASTAPAAAATPESSGGAGRGAGGLAGMLLIAVLGGLILNAMPCVLPILSLKVFGMVRSAGQGRGEVVRGALATAAGILVSFWVLAGLAVAAAAAGSAVGWGVQFQRPGFVTFLAVVVVLFCLNLWGLFEISLPGALARVGGTGAREGLAGHFGSGLFATLMATPCSAPFLGTAIGFALAQPAPIVFAIFTAVGTGLALPYLALAAAPGTARLLPRPGPWMDTLRGALGFVLAGSAVWLLYVLSAQVSPESLALVEVGLLLIALFTWMHHRAAPGKPAGVVAILASLAAAIATVAFAASGAGAPGSATRLAAQGRPAAGLIGWVAFDRARAESLSAGGQLVFVDVTADWCFTCKVNERLILDTPEIAGAFTRHHVLPMRADWTNRNDEIGRFLSANGRYGIPFYLLYRPGRAPYVFSELPTKSSIISALDAADAPPKQARRL
jgi:suppressor for copper-sensitivity B